MQAATTPRDESSTTTDSSQDDSFGRLDRVTEPQKDCARLDGYPLSSLQRGVGWRVVRYRRLHEQPMVASPSGIEKVRHDSRIIPQQARHFHLREKENCRHLMLCANGDVISMSEIGPSVCERISRTCRHLRIHDDNGQHQLTMATTSALRRGSI